MNEAPRSPWGPITTVVGSSHTASAADFVIVINCNGSARTVTLPPASTYTNRSITVKRVDAGSSSLTIRGSGVDTIDGLRFGSFASVIVRGMVSMVFVCNGTGWFIASGHEYLGRTVHMSWFGVDRTGTLDNAANVQAAIQSAAAIGGRLVDHPGGIYRVDSAITLRSGVVYDLPGVTIRAGAKPTTTITSAINSSTQSVPVADSTNFQAPNQFLIGSEWFLVTAASNSSGPAILTVTRGYLGTTPASHSNGATVTRSGMADDQSPIVLAQGISNFKVIGLTVDGNKRGGTFTGEGKHGYRIRGCSDFAFQDANATDCPGDGFILADRHDPVEHNSRGVFVNCDSFANKRNAWTVNDAYKVRWYSPRGRLTAGTAPEAGIDFEPNYASSIIGDLDFFGADFSENNQTGVLISLYKAASIPQGNIRFHGGSATDNVQDGVILHRARGVAFNEFGVRANGHTGYRFWTSAGTYSSSQDVAIRGGEVLENGWDGIDARTDDANRILGLTVDGVAIRDNGQDPPTTTLTAGIDAATTTVPVADTASFQRGAEFGIGTEWFQVTAASTVSGAGNLTVATRGYDSSTASSHSSGATLTRSADGIAIGYVPGQDDLPVNKHEGIIIRNNSIGSRRGDTATGQRYGISSTDDATDVTYALNDLRNNVRGAKRWADGGARIDSDNRVS